MLIYVRFIIIIGAQLTYNGVLVRTTAKCFSNTFTLFQILFSWVLSHSIGYSFLCFRVGPY